MTILALCVGEQHDPGLVLLALLVCFAGTAALSQVYTRIAESQGRCRLGWILLTAASTGVTVWCTHFVAMLAYRVHGPVVLDPVLTLCSLLIAIGLTVPGLLATTTRQAGMAPLGGAVVGFAIAAMHYSGMAAYRIDGLMLWDWRLVGLSLVLTAPLGAAAFTVLARARTVRGRAGAVVLLSSTVAALHFTGMAAVTVIPADTSGDGLSQTATLVMAVATALGGLMVFGCATVSAMIDGQMRADNMLRLNHLAQHDSLTGLPNRPTFQDAVQRRLARGGAMSTAVIKMDVIRFRAVVDAHGNEQGDQILSQLARRFMQVQQPGECIARLGGDEFAALKTFEGRGQLDEMLQRILQLFETPFGNEGLSVPLAVRVGVALAPSDGHSADRLLANADLALMRAKSQHAHRPCFYGREMDEAARARRELEDDLRRAIGSDQFELHYQVKVSLQTGEASGYEVLLRWTHPTRGPVSPGMFIPLAEEIGEIVRLSDWVLLQACTEAAGWTVPHKIAVNLSPVQLSSPDLIATINRTLARTGLPPSRLELELTESAIIKDRQQALAKLGEIRSMGISIALDDFGAGFSSLDVLRSFPFDRIKLDRSFMAEIEQSDQAVAILRSVTTLGRWLGIPILAEGIETVEQLDIARQEGCSDVQGYLLGRPARRLLAPSVPPARPRVRAA